MNYKDFIKSELLILVPVLYYIGLALKKSKVKNKYIPLILGAVSTFLSVIWVFSTGETESFKGVLMGFFTAFTQGILIAGATVYINQIKIQSKKDKKEGKK